MRIHPNVTVVLERDLAPGSLVQNGRDEICLVMEDRSLLSLSTVMHADDQGVLINYGTNFTLDLDQTTLYRFSELTKHEPEHVGSVWLLLDGTKQLLQGEERGLLFLINLETGVRTERGRSRTAGVGWTKWRICIPKFDVESVQCVYERS